MDHPDLPPADAIGIKEAAKLALCDLHSIHRWVRTGRIRGWRRCGRIFVSKAEVLGLFKLVRVRVKEEKEQGRPGVKETKRAANWQHEQAMAHLREMGVVR